MQQSYQIAPLLRTFSGVLTVAQSDSLLFRSVTSLTLFHFTFHLLSFNHTDILVVSWAFNSLSCLTVCLYFSFLLDISGIFYSQCFKNVWLRVIIKREIIEWNNQNDYSNVCGTVVLIWDSNRWFKWLVSHESYFSCQRTKIQFSNLESSFFSILAEGEHLL